MLSSKLSNEPVAYISHSGPTTRAVAPGRYSAVKLLDDGSTKQTFLMSGYAVSWLREIEPLRLGLSPCPPEGGGLVKAVEDWHTAGVAVVVSLLEPQEVRALGAGKESQLCAAAGIEFCLIPIRDQMAPPTPTFFDDLLKRLAERLKAGAPIVIHCHGGVGRSATLCGALLIELGHSPSEAIRMMTRARGVNVPHMKRQEDWLHAFGRCRSKWA